MTLKTSNSLTFQDGFSNSLTRNTCIAEPREARGGGGGGGGHKGFVNKAYYKTVKRKQAANAGNRGGVCLL